VQHFKLSLACGHSLEESAVDDYEGQPYKPTYVGKLMPSPPVRCCFGDHRVVNQLAIPRLTGNDN
jgi:hypothetical protein